MYLQEYASLSTTFKRLQPIETALRVREKAIAIHTPIYVDRIVLQHAESI